MGHSTGGYYTEPKPSEWQGQEPQQLFIECNMLNDAHAVGQAITTRVLWHLITNSPQAVLTAARM